MRRKIGILAIQGAFAEHASMLSALNVEVIEIRQKSHLENIELDGIILPGGESTVMGKLLRELDMFYPLKKLIEDGLPVLGTCAGLILLAKEVINDNECHLATMDISIKRNAYGRQLGSFQVNHEFKYLGEIPMTFIRAPYINSISNEGEILAIVDNNIVAARQNNMLVTSFHPELTTDLSVHKYFLDMI
ncbi:MAG: pyridoxal 5'-phosphate synthase glutaminase subunit PdxT [Firmicutes bacterium]|nr:pyridoxal 5'-phosphate synthase glutaminase subunit PdxT [Bacillota bacterium]